MPILKSILEKDYNLITVILNLIVNDNSELKNADKNSHDSDNQKLDNFEKNEYSKNVHVYLIEFGLGVVSCFCSESKYLLDKLIIE